MNELRYSEPEPKVIHGVKDDWEMAIGMEVHAQVQSNAKLFSGASTRFGPNRTAMSAWPTPPGPARCR